jgi:hypothetical protein
MCMCLLRSLGQEYGREIRARNQLSIYMYIISANGNYYQTVNLCMYY